MHVHAEQQVLKDLVVAAAIAVGLNQITLTKQARAVETRDKLHGTLAHLGFRVYMRAGFRRVQSVDGVSNYLRMADGCDDRGGRRRQAHVAVDG